MSSQRTMIMCEGVVSTHVGHFEKLRGGNLHSIGRVDEVAEDRIENPMLFGAVFEGLFDGDPVIRMMNADALEKASSSRPEHIQLFKRHLIAKIF